MYRCLFREPRTPLLRTARAPGMALLLMLAGAGAGMAQEASEPPQYSRFSGSVAVLNTQPLGGLETGPGLGMGVTAAWALDPGRRIRVRGELRAAGYGSESRRACLSETVGCLIEVDISTNYNAFYLAGGPELAVPVLGAKLVLAATAGLGSFTVTSSVRGISDPESQDLLRTDNFEDRFFAWSVGGELRVPVVSQLSVTLGTHYQHNGEASYVPEGGITRNSDGSLDIRALTSDANLVAITLGVAFRPHVGWADDEDERED